MPQDNLAVQHLLVAAHIQRVVYHITTDATPGDAGRPWLGRILSIAVYRTGCARMVTDGPVSAYSAVGYRL